MKSSLAVRSRKPRKSQGVPLRPTELGRHERSPFPSASTDAVVPHRQKEIEALAYNLYLQRGKEPGHALEDWLEAEKRFDCLIAKEQFGDTD